MAITSMTDEQKAASAAALAAANLASGAKAKSTGGTDLSGDFTFFLKMLTTQLQNQDPTEPMDVSQMTQQIATYSGVEQQVKTNANLEALLNSNKQSQLSTAVSYIGREIETKGNTGSLVYAQNGGKVGAAEYTYEIPQGVASSTVTITNEEGEVVYTGEGPTAAGKSTVTWNGVNSTTNKQVPAGNYTMKIVTKDSNGGEISTVSGRTSKLTFTDAQFGQAVFSYMLPPGTQSSKIVILDSAGKAVFTGEGTTKSGRNVVVWDGVNSFTNKQMAAGKYTIQVTAKDASGDDITPIDTRAVGVVDTVETDASGQTIFNVGDVQVKYDDVLAVREATPFYVPNAE
jgi:flagellar basal-body rod modification protein FlgD